MKKVINIFFVLVFQTCFFFGSFGQCKITASASPKEIFCGQSAVLTAFGIGEGTMVLSEDFNSGIGSGWSSTPGAVDFSNPCSPNGVDGSPHAWMSNNTSVPRMLVSQSYDLTAATAGVTICFDLKFAKQGDPAPCEGPDEPDEGVYLQYSTDGGITWNTIHYFHPKGGKNQQLINWNNYCFQVPSNGITTGTQFRWFQDNDSGKDYDHWGIDNVQIFQNDVNAEIVWGTSTDSYNHSYGIGSSGGEHPDAVSPLTTSTYNVKITTGSGAVCSTSVTVVVKDPIFEVDLISDPSPLCLGNCGDVVGSAVQVLDPGGIKDFENAEQKIFVGMPSYNDFMLVFIGCTKLSGCPCFCGGSVNLGQKCPCDQIPVTLSMNINAEPLNASVVSDGELLSVCIDHALVGGTNWSSFSVSLVCPNGTSIVLANAGDLSGSVLSNVCFSMLATAPVSSGSGTYSGTWLPVDDFSNLANCNASGVWTLLFSGTIDLTGGGIPSDLPFGYLDGWSFQYDDPPIHDTITNGVWMPAAGLSDPTSVNTAICPTTLGTSSYQLTISNGTAGCATHTETVDFSVSNCTDCTPPTITVVDLSVCEPNTINLSNAVSENNQNATLTYYSTENDAQNATNPLASNTISVSGTYYIRAEDPNDATCFAVFSVDVSVYPNPTPNISGNLSYCGATGTTLDAGDGYASYLWSNGQTTQTISTLATTSEGISVTVTTNDGCTATSDTVVVIQQNISANYTKTNTSCGQSNGTITITTSGGSGNYKYNLNSDPSVNFTSPHTITDLPAGTYTLAIMEGMGMGCNAIFTVVITDGGGNPPTLSSPTITNVSCDGANDGAITATASGGTGTLTYSITSSDTTTSNTTGFFSQLGSGSYVVKVTDDSGCSAQETVNILSNGAIVATIGTVVQPDCGANNGSIEVAVSGGSGVYQFQLNDDTPVTDGGSHVFSSLSAGTHTIVVTNGACSSTVNQVLNSASGPTLSTIVIIDVSCDGATDGAITTTASGGTGTLTYNITSSDTTTSNTTGVFSQLGSGSYVVKVTDDSGCSAQETVNILSNGAIVATIGTVIQPDCGANNGSIEVAVSGGSGVYQFQLNGDIPVTDGASHVFSSLSAGTHTIVITNGACSNTLTQNLSSVSAPTFSPAPVPKNVSCKGEINGTILAWASGGIGTLTYSITSNEISDSNESGFFFNLGPGSYTVKVQDQNGCATVEVVEITEPDEVLNVVLKGENGKCTDASVCNGFITWATMGGVAPYTISVDNVPQIGDTITSLCEGTYHVMINDAMLCSYSETIIIEASNMVQIDTVLILDSGCAGECSGVVEIQSTTANAYTLDALSSNSGIFHNVCAGEHVVSAIDDNGCLTTQSIVILSSQPPKANFDFQPKDLSISNSTIHLFNKSINGQFFEWTILNTTTSFFVSSNGDNFSTVLPGDAGTYRACLVAHNASGCTDTMCQRIQMEEEIILYVPNTFTPDDNEHNQTMRVVVSGIDPDAFTLSIYNRWGEMIFESHDYSVGWNGYYDTSKVPSGIYTWQIDVKTRDGEYKKNFVGHVNVMY